MVDLPFEALDDDLLDIHLEGYARRETTLWPIEHHAARNHRKV